MVPRDRTLAGLLLRVSGGVGATRAAVGASALMKGGCREPCFKGVSLCEGRGGLGPKSVCTRNGPKQTLCFSKFHFPPL